MIHSGQDGKFDKVNEDLTELHVMMHKMLDNHFFFVIFDGVLHGSRLQGFVCRLN